MPKESFPITHGVRFLRENGISFEPRLYRYKAHGGTGNAAVQLGVPEHRIVKTLVMETEEKRAFLVLMHGDRAVSTKQLARVLQTKEVHPCSEADAQRKTGYTVGGISPFGTKTDLKVYVESSILEMDTLLINAGKRGFLVEISPADLGKCLTIHEVAVARD